MKTERVNPPYNPDSQGSRSRVIFEYGTQFFRGECCTRVAWVFSWNMKMRETPLEQFT